MPPWSHVHPLIVHFPIALLMVAPVLVFLGLFWPAQRVGIHYAAEKLLSEFDAVVLCTGATKPRDLPVPGRDLRGVHFAMEFLQANTKSLLDSQLKDGKYISAKDKDVIVIGGGNTAIDCVRVALREGAELSCLVYRRSRKEMPADVWEVDGAAEEGVQFEFQVLPTKIIANDKDEVTGVECVRMALGEPDASGRRRPEPMAGSEFVIECETVIPAIGQDMDLSFIPADMGIDITKWNTVVTKYLPLKDAAGKDLKDSMGNPLSRTLMTDCDGVFAGGDAEIGPLTVVACVGNAHRAASVIQRWLEEGQAYLNEQDIFDDLLTYLGVYDKGEQVPWLDSAERANQKEVHGRERAAKGNYREVELGFSDSSAQAEADRCLRCYRMALVVV